MSAKHTPGPWKARQDVRSQLGRYGMTLYANTSRPEMDPYPPVEVAYVPCDGMEGQDGAANLALIAAAPEMLAALKAAEALLLPARPDSVGGNRALDMVRAAITKAEGGES